MIKINIEMPSCCDKCFALDDNVDYPYCLILHTSRGYNFNTELYRMPNCPLEEIDEEKKPCEWCQEWDCEGCKYAK